MSALLGVVQNDISRLVPLRRVGIRNITLHLAWRELQPVPGPLNVAAVQRAQRQLVAYQHAGYSVTIEFGIQYTPDWVMTPAARFVDQYGTTLYRDTDSGENVADAVHSPRVRAQLGAYIGLVAAALGASNFYAARCGGLLTGELRYPRATDGGRNDSIWAPRGVSTDQYLQDMADYMVWLMTTVHDSFPHAMLYAMLPSWGSRTPVTAATPLTPAAPEFEELAQGLDLPRLVHALVGLHATVRVPVVAYTTWLDAAWQQPTVTNYPLAELARLTAGTPIYVGGENTVDFTTNKLAYQVTQARVAYHHARVFNWFTDSDLIQFYLQGAA